MSFTEAKLPVCNRTDHFGQIGVGIRNFHGKTMKIWPLECFPVNRPCRRRQLAWEDEREGTRVRVITPGSGPGVGSG